MEIPVVIHKDEGSVYGVSVPDIPGCYSWGDDIEAAMKNVRVAIHSHVETMLTLNEPVEIKASRIEDLQGDEEFRGGVWALIDVDLTKLDAKPERINISLPRFVLSKIDRFAESRHETRSGLIARATLSLIEKESE